ncbi:MAG TPA: AraC family transcriptional regulator [Clostridia bacterium]|nr:AraC family transcriptional regulator [Clostridia bacterium]
MEYITVGKNIHEGYCLDLVAYSGDNFQHKADWPQRLCLAFLEQGSAVMTIHKSDALYKAPAIFCFNDKDMPGIRSQSEVSLKTIYFHPNIINKSFSFERSQHYISESERMDAYLLNPFFHRNSAYNGFIEIDQVYSHRISRLFQKELQELVLQKDMFWPCRSRSFLLELLLLTGSIFEASNNNADKRLNYEANRMDEIVSYLQANYSSKITVNSLAKTFNSNRTTLNIQFKKIYNMSIIDYLIKLRINLASAMLRDTRLNVEEIMERVGFSNSTHFWRMFKKYTGVSPSTYRNQNCWVD